MYSLLESLNAQQQQAVQHVDGALLVLAGAGSGKTKTITTRLAYLLGVIGIPPQNTLTLTFTNKAAKEMQQRALCLIADANLAISTSPLLCTFHKFGLLFLQKYIHFLGRSQSFQVIDEEDKKKILKNIRKGYSRYEIIPSVFELLNFISDSKNNNLTPEERIAKDIFTDSLTEIKIEIYKQYQDFLRVYNLVDFDDLLLLPYKILAQNTDLKQSLSEKYQYIMVDEYQDVNNLQASFLQQLCTTHQNLCVVGDDDQSIYGWRGANIDNILEFHKRFENTKIITLEQNYRSTKQILHTANQLIAHNAQRHDKTLKTDKTGENVRVLASVDGKEEMQKIISRIKEIKEAGEEYSTIAILFRLNPLSRNVEHCFSQAKIPYQIIGGTRFYERQEIKDVLAYLRLGLNQDDNFSLARIINKPRRGIGEKSLQDIIDKASNYKSIHDAFRHDVYNHTRYYNKLQDVFDIIDLLHDCMQDNLGFLNQIFETRIKLYHEKDISDSGGISNEERRQNIRQLFEWFDEYCQKADDLTFPRQEDIVRDFLNNAALSTDTDKMGEQGVLCMSIHNSKGLEFQHVFVIGMERGLFPLRDGEEIDYYDDSQTTKRADITEERRLAYVAFTRAKSSLTFSYVKNRFYRGKIGMRDPSQFLMESGVVSLKDFEELIKEGKNTESDTILARDSEDSKTKNQTQLCKGDCVQHKIWGFGRVEKIQGSGLQASATVNFGGLKKNILLSFLTKM
ncbi:ATP-dependent helicase [Helicobacter aurati]|nr:UvrD-helicase domain-containing protein [Helicobacter aurati]